MKKLLSIWASVFTLALPIAAQAGENFYVGGQAGVNFLDVRSQHHLHLNMDAGYALGAVVGYKFFDDFRVEGEVSYRDNCFKNARYNSLVEESYKFSLNGHARMWSFMANGYYDLPVNWVLRPYVGAGIGYDISYGSIHHHSMVHEHTRFKVREFAWQAMTGVNYDLSDDLQLNLEYKYHKGFDRTHLSNNTASLGVKTFF